MAIAGETPVTFDELWRANVPLKGDHVDAFATQETAARQSIEASEKRDELELTDADLLFLWEVGIKP
jgi:hypothetical protein